MQKIYSIRKSLALTIENCVRSIAQNLIDELVTESFTDVRGGPEQPDRDATLKDIVGTWTDARAGGDENHTAEHGGDPEDTIGRETTNPKLGKWALNDISRPVTSAGNDEGELVLLGFRDGSKSVPLREREISGWPCRCRGGLGNHESTR